MRDKVTPNRRRRGIIVVIIVLAVIIAAGLGLFFWLRSRSQTHARNVEEFKKTLKEDWSVITEESEKVTASLIRVTAAADLPAVAGNASEMREKLAPIISRAKKNKPPSGMGEIAEKHSKALDSLDSYLDMVVEMASSGNEAEVLEDRGLLENRATRALADVNEFLRDAQFIQVTIPGGFYQAGLTLQYAYVPPPSEADELARQQVYDVITRFMKADIENYDPEVIWSLSSSLRKTAMEAMGISREKFAADWPSAWGGHRPVDFYVSKPDITFPTEGVALANVVVYTKRGATLMEELRLVLEPDGWKIEDYPFVGWG